MQTNRYTDSGDAIIISKKRVDDEVRSYHIVVVNLVVFFFGEPQEMHEKKED